MSALAPSSPHKLRRKPLLAGTFAFALDLVLASASAMGNSPTSAPTRDTHTPAADSAPVLKESRQPTSRPSAWSEEMSLAEDSLDDLKLLDLEVPAVVTAATRREQKVSALPQAVSIITKDDIRLSGARNVTDALRLVPGMDVADLSYGNAAAQPRGMQWLIGRNARILVDGHQLYDSMLGGPLWGPWPFLLEDIERIEVIRGPAGVTWGANAINGVINIVTKDPADQKGLTLRGGGGSRGVTREYTGYGIQVDKLRLRASGEYERTDGFRKGGSFLRGLEDDYRAARGSVHAIYEATPNDTFTLSAANAETSNLFPPAPQALLEQGSHNGSQATYLLGRWKHRIADDNNVEASAYVNDCWTSAGMKPLDYRYQEFAFELVHTLKPAENHTLTYGFDSRADVVETGTAYPYLCSKKNIGTGFFGLYAEDEWRFAPKWALTLGGRIDYEFYGGFQPSARIALSRELTSDSLLYASVSRGYQMTPAGVRFLRMPVLDGLAYVTADRDVRPTTLIAYEAGYRAKPFDRLNMDLNVFCHSYDDFVFLAPALGPPGLLRFDTRNDGRALTYGLEWEGRYNITDNLTLLGNYTFEITDWEAPALAREKDVMSAPRNKFMTGVRYSPLKDLHLSAHMYYADAIKTSNPANPFGNLGVDSYLRLDLRAEYCFWKDRASVSVGVSNLLDPDHFEGASKFTNNAEVPRMVYAELRLRMD